MKDTELTVVALNQYIKYCKITTVNEVRESLLISLSDFSGVEHSVKTFVNDDSWLRYGDSVSV